MPFGTFQHESAVVVLFAAVAVDPAAHPDDSPAAV